jgi:hypothetical protein
MPFEVQIKMVDEFTDREIKEYTEELRNLRLLENEESPSISEEEFWASKRKYTYRPMTIHVEDCVPFSKYDNKHTILNYGENSYMAKIKYEEFRSIFEAITGMKIRTLDEFKFDTSSSKTK